MVWVRGIRRRGCDITDALFVPQEFVAEVGVAAMPTFKAFKDGKESGNLTGADPTKLAQLVADAKA